MPPDPIRTHGTPPWRMVALHGFTQHGGMFEELASLSGWGIVAPDLPGHGAAATGEASFDRAVDVVRRALEAAGPGPMPVLGYSLGGRVAVVAAARSPERVSHLFLVSVGAGPSGAARATRRRDDERLATRIAAEPLDSFVDEWLAAPMFAGLARRPSEWRRRDRAIRLENRPAGLAAALRGLGQGVQPDLEAIAASLAIPVTLVVGGEDGPYRSRGRRLVAACPHGELVVVSGAGHALIGEAPDRLIEVLRSRLP